MPNDIIQLFIRIVFLIFFRGFALFFGKVFVFGFVVEIDDDRGEDGDHDDAIEAQDHGQDAAEGGGDGQIAEADRREDGEGIPKAIFKGRDAWLHDCEIKRAA